MNYADIAILAIMGLLIISGFIRGFWRTFSKGVNLIISVALAFLLATKLAPVIFQGDSLNFLNEMVSPLIANTDIASGNLIKIGNEWFVEGGGFKAVALQDALGMMFVPKFLQAPIIGSAASLTVVELLQGVTVGTLVASAYTHLLSMFLSGAIVFIASTIVVGVISRLIYNAINARNFHRAIDRILGGVLRVFTGALVVIVILHVIGVISGFSFMQPVMDEIYAGKISGPLFEADLLSKIFYGEGFNKIMDIFNDIIMVVAPEEQVASIVVGGIL